MTALKIADLQRVAKEEGREEGISVGAYQKALETARAFLAEGLAPAMVAQCTGLSLERVQELAKK